MNRADEVFALFVDANPVADVSRAVIDRPRLELVLPELEGSDMQTQERIIRLTPPEEPPRRRRALTPALAAAIAVVVVGVGAVVLFSGDDAGGPVAEVPDLRSDLSNIGEVLTAAHNADDPEVFLSLFAEDGVLRYDNEVFTPEEIRTAGVLSGKGLHIQYDRGWVRVMNQRYEYSSCQVNDDRVLCDMAYTSDYLTPLLPPDPHTIAAQVSDGEIVMYWVTGLFSAADDIRANFQDWTQENYPEEAALMWEFEWQAEQVHSEESALLHLRLGQEYVQQQGS